MRKLGLALLAVILVGCESPMDAVLGTHIRVINSSSSAVVDVYISPCTSDSWGADKLSDQIAPGISKDFSVEPGCYDIGAVLQDRREVEFNGQNIKGGTTNEYTITN